MNVFVDELVHILICAACLVALVFGAWCVSEGGEIVGQKYDATIIGGFIIAWLNTAPETIFFINSLENNHPEFAVGAMTGSVIVVCTVALGACIYLGGSARDSCKIYLLDGVRKQAMFLGASLLVVALMVQHGFSWVLGALGIVEYLFFIGISLKRKGDERHNKDLDLELGDEVEEEVVPLYKGVLFLIVGGVIIICCSSPFIEAVMHLGVVLGINPLLLAFFFAPIASEAPEILESISLSRKGKTQNINIAFSNLVGGTITKTTLLLGLLSFYGVWRKFEWESPSYTISLLCIVVCAGAAAFCGMITKEVPRYWGQLMIVLFLATSLSQIIISGFGYHILSTEMDELEKEGIATIGGAVATDDTIGT